MGLLVQRPGVTQAQTSLPGMLYLPASGHRTTFQASNVQRPYNGQREILVTCLPFGLHKCARTGTCSGLACSAKYAVSTSKSFPTNASYIVLFSCVHSIIAYLAKRLRVWTARSHGCSFWLF
eukprot:6666790-Pyramimonas_sp.AAC.1